jgi:hypothetical protein
MISEKNRKIVDGHVACYDIGDARLPAITHDCADGEYACHVHISEATRNNKTLAAVVEMMVLHRDK